MFKKKKNSLWQNFEIVTECDRIQTSPRHVIVRDLRVFVLSSKRLVCDKRLRNVPLGKLTNEVCSYAGFCMEILIVKYRVTDRSSTGGVIDLGRTPLRPAVILSWCVSTVQHKRALLSSREILFGSSANEQSKCKTSNIPKGYKASQWQDKKTKNQKSKNNFPIKTN